MPPRLPPRVLGLAIGAGALVGGLVIALLGLVLGTGYVGLMASGLVMAAMGALVAIVASIGFAMHGSARSRSEWSKRTRPIERRVRQPVVIQDSVRAVSSVRMSIRYCDGFRTSHVRSTSSARSTSNRRAVDLRFGSVSATAVSARPTARRCAPRERRHGAKPLTRSSAMSIDGAGTIASDRDDRGTVLDQSGWLHGRHEPPSRRASGRRHSSPA